ncbi:MAG: hypothetical protein JWM27_2423 [Gemmatimonadetes bacterium]|nr:hypothetical protein [Gemmatimonadota bacterium]
MRRSVRNDEPHNFWPVYSDVALSTVLVLVLLLLGQVVLNSRQLVERNYDRDRLLAAQQALRDKLATLEGVTCVEENGDVQTLTLNSDFLFPPDSAALKAAGTHLLERMAPFFTENQGQYDHIVVEGHADSRPSVLYARLGDLKRDHGNWRLSAERAIQVVQALQGLGVDGSRLAAVGRSSYEPAASGPDCSATHPHAGFEADRRIKIQLWYSERHTILPPASQTRGRGVRQRRG